MRRRRFFSAVPGLAVAPAASLAASSAGQPAPGRIGIVGAGIVGASIALHLARRGAEVVVFEREGPAAGATGNSFAWINASFSKRPRSYFHLNWLGVLGWRQLEAEVEAVSVRWGGCLEYREDPERAALFEEQLRRHQAWGYPVRRVDADEFARLEPGLRPRAPMAGAVWARAEGAIEPRSVNRALLDAAEAAGARVVLAEVEALDLRNGTLRGVRTSAGEWSLDALALAAGTGAPALAAQAGIALPLVESPGILAHTRPGRTVVNRVVLAPEMHFKQIGGRLTAGVGFSGAGSTDHSPEVGERILETVKSVASGSDFELDEVTLGYRVLPRDGFPVVGFHPDAPGIYFASMHSGVTLAPAIGAFAATEILDRVEVAALGNYRPSRF